MSSLAACDASYLPQRGQDSSTRRSTGLSSRISRSRLACAWLRRRIQVCEISGGQARGAKKATVRQAGAACGLASIFQRSRDSPTARPFQVRVASRASSFELAEKHHGPRLLKVLARDLKPSELEYPFRRARAVSAAAGVKKDATLCGIRTDAPTMRPRSWQQGRGRSVPRAR